MSKWKAYVTRGFPGEQAMERLKKEFDVVQKTGWVEPTREEYLENLKDVDVMLTYSDTIDGELLEHAPKLKFIADNWGARNGIDHVAAVKHGITICDEIPNSYDWIVKGVADIAWGLMISAGRRFREGDDLVRSGKWTHSEQSNHQLLGQAMFGRTLGIYGAGRIGTEVAKRAAGFDMNILYTDVNSNCNIEALGAKRVEKQELFARSDYIAICLSASSPEENHHMVGTAEFHAMKKSACLVNVTRGWVIDEKAMLAALKAGEFAGAGLEVFEKEPQVDEELCTMKNVMMVPHAGGALYLERARVFEAMVDACIRFKKEYEASHS